jgi:hypothetical protein
VLLFWLQSGPRKQVVPSCCPLFDSFHGVNGMALERPSVNLKCEQHEGLKQQITWPYHAGTSAHHSRRWQVKVFRNLRHCTLMVCGMNS